MSWCLKIFCAVGALCLTNTSLSESSDPIATFTSSLISISEKCIPKTSTNPKKSNPWYNDDCKEAIKQRKQTLSRFCKFSTNENLNTYRNSRAKARRTIKSDKRKSWRTYVSKLNYKTPTKKVWDMVRKISGKTKTATYQHLNTNFNNGSELASTKQDKKVQVGKDQEKAQSEKDSLSKNRGGKKPN